MDERLKKFLEKEQSGLDWEKKTEERLAKIEYYCAANIRLFYIDINKGTSLKQAVARTKYNIALAEKLAIRGGKWYDVLVIKAEDGDYSPRMLFYFNCVFDFVCPVGMLDYLNNYLAGISKRYIWNNEMFWDLLDDYSKKHSKPLVYGVWEWADGGKGLEKFLHDEYSVGSRGAAKKYLDLLAAFDFIKINRGKNDIISCERLASKKDLPLLAVFMCAVLFSNKNILEMSIKDFMIEYDVWDEIIFFAWSYDDVG